MLEINQSYPCKVGYYGSKRDTSKIKYIVMHYTGNAKDTALANAKYFHTSINRSASAHYFVDETSIYQSVKDNYVAWSVGDKGTGKLKGIATNSNTLNIEMCTSGGSEVSEATENNAVELVKYLMNKYGIDANHVARHYDITKKSCPSASFRTGDRWSKFIAKLGGSVQDATMVSPAPSAKVKSYLSQGDKGNAVRTMQTMLIACGYSCGKYGADGSFGTGSKNALKSFQKDHGLTVDGLYGNSSKAKLEAVYNTRNTANKPSGNDLVRSGQQHTINYTGHQISVDGYYGNETKKNIVRCFQVAMNHDYRRSLAVDGIAGSGTLSALGKHYVKQGESQELVRAVQVALYCHGYNPQGTDAVFGANTKAAVVAFQKAHGLSADGVAGRNTILKLMGK